MPPHTGLRRGTCVCVPVCPRTKETGSVTQCGLPTHRVPSLLDSVPDSPKLPDSQIPQQLGEAGAPNAPASHVLEPPPLNEGERPLFLSAQNPESWKKPEGMTWGQYSLAPDKPLNARQYEVARLAFLGKTNTEIAEAVGYTEPWVCRLLQAPRVTEEIERFRDKAFERTVGERLKGMGPQAASVIEGILRDEMEKPALRADLAKWTLEKLTGKARQEVDVGSSTLGAFFKLLEEKTREAGSPLAEPAAGPTIDVTPQSVPAPAEPEAPGTDFASWVDEQT